MSATSIPGWNHFSLRQTQRSLQDLDYMVHAVGFGIRYRTPVGPLRVDLGYSINPPTFFGLRHPTGSDQRRPEPCLNSPKCVVQNVSHFQYFFSIGPDILRNATPIRVICAALLAAAAHADIVDRIAVSVGRRGHHAERSGSRHPRRCLPGRASSPISTPSASRL